MKLRLSMYVKKLIEGQMNYLRRHILDRGDPIPDQSSGGSKKACGSSSLESNAHVCQWWAMHLHCC